MEGTIFFSKGLMHGMVVVSLAGFFLVTVIIGQSLEVRLWNS